MLLIIKYHEMIKITVCKNKRLVFHKFEWRQYYWATKRHANVSRKQISVADRESDFSNDFYARHETRVLTRRVKTFLSINEKSASLMEDNRACFKRRRQTSSFARRTMKLFENLTREYLERSQPTKSIGRQGT